MRPPKITIVTAVRGKEPLIRKTLENARDTAGVPIDVITVWDGQKHDPDCEPFCTEIVETASPLGTSRAKHEGVIRAKTALVCVVDAHMAFSDGWAKELADWYGVPAMRKTVSCASIGNLSADFEHGPDWNYHGARFRRRDRNDGNKEHYAYVAKWCGENKPGAQIGCIMGAMYAFRRKWYDEMAQPWAAGTGWGLDEEMLSAGSWLCGGDVRLMPNAIHAWHQFRDRPAYEPDHDHILRIWINRFRYLHMLPMPEAERADAIEWQARSAMPVLVPDFMQQVEMDLQRIECKRIKERWESGRWQEFVERWVDNIGVPKKASVPEKVDAPDVITTLPPKQVFYRQREKCNLCDALDSFRVKSTQGNRQYLRCQHCGNTAVRVNGTIKQGVFCD